jgi:sulfofructose kinase
LVAAARLGCKTAYWSVLGDDELSRFTIQELEREKVDCTPILRRAEARPYHSIVVVDQSTGERTIFYSGEGVTLGSAEEISDELIARCRVLFVDHLTASTGLRAVELAHAHAIPVVADIEQETRPRAVELMGQADHLVVGIKLAGRVTGETRPERMVQALSRAERACCVVTAGEKGCWYSEHGSSIRHFPAFKVQVVDTTGCGDVFHGAYAACIANGESVAMAIRVATATAGLKATQPGGRSGIPDRPTVDQFLNQNREYF